MNVAILAVSAWFGVTTASYGWPLAKVAILTVPVVAVTGVVVVLVAKLLAWVF